MYNPCSGGRDLTVCLLAGLIEYIAEKRNLVYCTLQKDILDEGGRISCL